MPDDKFVILIHNFNSILNFHFQTLKIDKSIIDNIKNKKRQFVIKSMVDISRHLGYKITAEGVETKEQLDILTGLGCSRIQGHYFSKPLSSRETEELLRKNMVEPKDIRTA